jgi:hypothetical protein
MDAIRNLADHLARSQLVLFLGADLPSALTGLPDRVELARGLARHAGVDEHHSLAAITQRVMQGGSRFVFIDYLDRQLDTAAKQPPRIYQLIVRLPVRVIITTAYDDMLERAFEQAGERINRIITNSDLNFGPRDRRRVIKLYGDLRQRDTLVVTEDDHYDLWHNHTKERLLSRVRDELSSNAVLFLGHTLNDPDFNLLWRDMLARVGDFAVGAFAVCPGMPEGDRAVWRTRQVRIIDGEPLDFLERLVVAIGETLPLPQPPPMSEAPTMLAPQATTGAAVGLAATKDALELSDEDPTHITELLQLKQRRLRELEKTAAYYGMDRPAHIALEIEDLQKEIARLLADTKRQR